MVKKSSVSQMRQGKGRTQKSKINKFGELDSNQLRWTCPESMFKFKTTAEIKPLDKIVGQPRAVEAIRLGAELFSKGYNIFVTGISGTGRSYTVKKILEEVTSHKPELFDYCYVNNFENPDAPRLIKLPAGKGKEFSKSMNDAITFLRQRLPKLFEEERYQHSRKKILEHFQRKEKDLLHEFDEKIQKHDFIRGQIENEQGVSQVEIFPVVEGNAVQIDEVEGKVTEGKITKKQSQDFRKYYKLFHSELYDLSRSGMKLVLDMRQALIDNDKAAAKIEVETIFNTMKDKFPNEKVSIYINEVKKFIEENVHFFVQIDTPPQQNPDEDSSQESDKFKLFSVNVILDNSTCDSAPVIIERTPTYTNLFGTIERSYDSSGYWKTDFTKIKAGSILRADQGYILMNAMDAFNEPGVWVALRRVLIDDILEIQPYDSFFQLSQLHLKPEPIEVKVKVILIGGLSLYSYLYEYEKGFKKIFKVNAQFDYETEKTDEMIHNISRFISKICTEDNLPHCTPDGVSAIIEWAAEHAGSQKRLTLKFSDVADILREAAFYDRNSRQKYINREDVEKAVEWRRKRNDLLDDKLKLYILDGSTLIDTTGERIGQINGLTVIDTGMMSFGKPSRITASISVGNQGIVNIEREADLSGSIHNKGVLILSGIFRDRFAQNKPLYLSASIAFEQNYGGIDGDSATAAEIYTLLSAICRVPIKQSIAITGSVNQKGDIQPIGGVNEKIRGFFEICKERGFTGNQGVIIPYQNVSDLMLCPHIIESVNDGKFHIYPIQKIEDGIEILMGLPAGEMDKEGKYPSNTIFGMVDARLEELRQAAKEQPDKKKKKKSKSKSIYRVKNT
ncbi:MAG: AAA family ATPase [Ignavibacteriae bacterium]|nr:AAA family ATPase [Ignavibacteriota bacterium]